MALKRRLVPGEGHKYFYIRKGIFYERCKGVKDRRLFSVGHSITVDKIGNIGIYNRAFDQGLFNLKAGDILYYPLRYYWLVLRVVYIKKDGSYLLKGGFGNVIRFSVTDILGIIEHYYRFPGY